MAQSYCSAGPAQAGDRFCAGVRSYIAATSCPDTGRACSSLGAFTFFKALEDVDVVIVWIVPVFAFGHVFNQVAHDGGNAVMRMEAENVFCPLNRNLVIADVLNMRDVKR
jgi:hypothetical protein